MGGGNVVRKRLRIKDTSYRLVLRKKEIYMNIGFEDVSILRVAGDFLS